MIKTWMKWAAPAVLVAGMMLPVTAYAQEQSYTAVVKVRVAGLQNGQAMERYVQVGPEAYTNTAGDKVQLDKPTALGALIALMQKEGGQSFEVKTSSFGDYVTKIAGRSEKEINNNTGWSVWINDQPPTVGADKAELHAGDEVVWGFSDWMQTLYPKVELSTLRPESGKTYTVKVTADKTTYDEAGTPKTETVNIDNAVVRDEAGQELAKTDANGVATLNADEAGLQTFYVEKRDAETDLPLIVQSGEKHVLVQTPDATFKDIKDVQWAVLPIERLAEQGIIVGNEAGNFEPTRVVTRGELAKMVALMGDLNLGGPKQFSDVAADNPYNLFIQTVEKRGLMTGDAAGTFRPDAPVTREELATVIARLDGLKPATAVNLSFSDLNAASAYALPYVQAAVSEGLMQGTPEGAFRFAAAATRAEVATVLSEVLQETGHQHNQ